LQGIAMRLSVLALLAAVACLASDRLPKAPAKLETDLWAAITVGHNVWTEPAPGADLPLIMEFSLVNDGSSAVDPEIKSSKLLINGKEFPNWAFSVANGPKGIHFDNLPPGQSFVMAKALGRHFATPGTYRVVWKGKDFQSNELVFRVFPRK
jgi:hypothetical protein